MGAGTSPAEPEFFCLVNHATFRQLRNTDFHQIWSRNVVRYPVDESAKTFSKIFTLEVICPQNLKSQTGQTGTSLRAGYRSRDAPRREILCTPRCSQSAGEFRRLVNFSVRRTVAELRSVKVAKCSDFGLFSPYSTPKTYLPVTSLQPITE